ncbi:uncharacterized protein LOC112952178 [Nothoprocta perdicaria]|uniref:uncharacterized protein LOC112952178 n=1 Tax=Nothoprocta perdicaria TaxID=30464 RepID=UPI000E1B8E81|nr:uncharacterized protein LOC112952178 [Nothoprocta perdicaria]
MPRGRAWTQAEIRCLLALVGACGEVALLMASTSRPNEALWRDISRGLAAAGYSRSVTQCRSKWKALKQAFYSERETRRQAGRHSPRVPPHYRAMKTIWKAAGRPVFGERRLPDRVKLPPRKRGTPLEDHAPSSPEQQELITCTDTLGTAPSQSAKDEPLSPRLDQVAGASPAAHAGHPFAPLPHLGFHTACPALKQEIAEGKAGCPGETSLAMGAGNLPVATRASGSPRRAAMSEQTAASEEASGAGLQGAGVAALLQSVQQLLVQILQTSQQQQVLLESLASDTVSHLHVISDNLVQVGETLHELLLRAHARAGALPSPLDHYISRVPLFGGSPRPTLLLGVPCSPGTPQDSPCHKEEPLGSPATGFAPP